MTGEAIFDALGEPASRRISGGLARIALVLRNQEWQGAEADGITPTQAQALRVLRDGPGAMRLSALAAQLGVSAPTTSARVDALVNRGLVVRIPGPDKRSIGLELTPAGVDVVDRSAQWPDFLTSAVDVLDADEQEDLLRSLVKVVRTLQVGGRVAPQRMCLSCTHFRPFAHAGPGDDARLPHHCGFVDAPFGDRHLRLACTEHEEAPAEQQEQAWEVFEAGSRGGERD